MKTLPELIDAVRPLSLPGSRAGRFSEDVAALINYLQPPFQSPPSQITYTLTDALHDCRARTGEEPTRIYLGEIEHKELVDTARAFCVFRYHQAETRPDRLKWNGLEVFLVDSKSYIGFGLDPSSPCG